MGVPNIAGVILAAGLSSRMGDDNKLLMEWRGRPMLSHVATAALNSRLGRVIVVTGHEADRVTEMIPSEALVAHNGDYASGMASSLKTGLVACEACDGMMVLLGDMPLVTSNHINILLDAFSDAGTGSIVMAALGDRVGNPVLFSKIYFKEFRRVSGDTGAKNIVRTHADNIRLVDIGEAALRDFDTREAFEY